jgi:hypothetical protein
MSNKGVYIRLSGAAEAQLRALAAREGESLGAIVTRALALLSGAPTEPVQEDDAKVRAAMKRDAGL